METFKNYEIKGTTLCDCGHEFTLKDFKELIRINSEDAKGFYSNLARHYSPSKCPKCCKETLLILKQAGQTWKVLDIATKKNANIEEQEDTTTEQTTIENNELSNPVEGFICQECGQVCKSKSGLIAHMKKHNN